MLKYAAGIAMTRRFWNALAALECVRASSLDEEAEEHASRHRFSRMLTYAHVCSRMLTYAHVCSRMAELYLRVYEASVCGLKLVQEALS
jgi:hypothetical protein